MAQSHPFAFIDENVRVGYGMDPDDKLKGKLPSLLKTNTQSELRNTNQQPQGLCCILITY